LGEIKDVKLGASQVNKIYCGTDLVFEKIIDITAPITTVYPSEIYTYLAGQQMWLEVNEMCTTYFTTDGSTPTTASPIFREAFTVNETTTFKYFSVDLAGNVEAVKTTVFNIEAAGAAPTTTISPSSTTQNSIPFNVSLSSDEVGATIYYRLGTGTQQTYTAPFPVNQTSAGVLSANILVTYWAVGAEGTEAEKSITYNTAGAIAGKAVVTTFASSWYVSVDWGATANATSYNVYRSTTEGVLGDLVSEFNAGLHYDDNWAMNGTVYYYTVRAANYGGVGALSDQAIATPPLNEPAEPSGWRYLKIEGYGSVEEAATTRLIEFEAWEGVTNWMRQGGLTYSHQAISTGGLIGTIHDGIKTTSGYPIWWTAPTPNANIVIDFGTSRPFTKLNYYSYSTAGVPRTNRFKILASNTNNGTDWQTLWDNSTGQLGVQPALPLGYEKVL